MPWYILAVTITITSAITVAIPTTITTTITVTVTITCYCCYGLLLVLLLLQNREKPQSWSGGVLEWLRDGIAGGGFGDDDHDHLWLA